MKATDENVPLDWQYGSGGGSNKSIGGGRIVLISKSFSISGNVSASGLPSAANTSAIQVVSKKSFGNNHTYRWWIRWIYLY